MVVVAVFGFNLGELVMTTFRCAFGCTTSVHLQSWPTRIFSFGSAATQSCNSLRRAFLVSMLVVLPTVVQPSPGVSASAADATNKYASRINSVYGSGVSPDANAAVLLIEAMGPRPEGTPLPAEYYRLLGTNCPPEKGTYFVPFGAGLTPSAQAAAQRDFSRAMSRPWKSEEFPEVAKWLEQNRAPMQLVKKAVQRSDYYVPLVPPTDEQGQSIGLIQTLLPHVQELRSLGRCLLCQAYLHMESKEYLKAWDDLIACHRLGRLTSRGPTLIDYLVGGALSSMAFSAEEQLLATAAFDSEQLKRIRRDLESLPAWGDVSRAMNLTERLMFMDTVDVVASGRIEELDVIGVDMSPSPLGWRIASVFVDWNLVKQRGTLAYDQLHQTMQEHQGVGRLAALDALSGNTPRLHRASVRGLLKELLRQGSVRKVASAAMGDALVDMMLPAVANVDRARLRFQQRDDVLMVGVKVYEFHAANGHFPAALSSMVPEYLPRVPVDSFVGKPLRYDVTADGFRLYSLGENRTDDEGKTFGQKERADDLIIQKPATLIDAN